MGPRGFGHAHGVNMANYRMLSENKSKETGYRSTYDWQQESEEHADMGFNEYKLSSTLRQATTQLQAASNEQVMSDTCSVEAALKSKLRHTDQLKAALTSTLSDTVTELSACAMMKASMEQRLSRVTEKLALNETRLQVRNSRPARERTMDDVESVLLHQQGLMASFMERVKRAISHLDREIQQLDNIRRKLEADLKDKLDAMEVDSMALLIKPNGTSGQAGALPRKSELALKTPTAWVHSTEDNINNARRWLSDSMRLRKAIRRAIADARTAEHDMTRNLNAQLLNKIGVTKGLKNQLETQLARVAEELSSAHAQRISLARDLDAKRGPLQQAKDRLQARKARPDREQVSDDVEAALSVEIAHLNSITMQLSSKLNAVDKTISTLDLTSMTLADNIRDKETTLTLDERMAMLDGRITLSTAPPSSVGSFSAASHVSELRDLTMKRITELEAELVTARKEREQLEDNVVHLRSSLATPPSRLAHMSSPSGRPALTSSPKGPLSPTRLFTPSSPRPLSPSAPQ